MAMLDMDVWSVCLTLVGDLVSGCAMKVIGRKSSEGRQSAKDDVC